MFHPLLSHYTPPPLSYHCTTTIEEEEEEKENNKKKKEKKSYFYDINVFWKVYSRKLILKNAFHKAFISSRKFVLKFLL